jgi:hypothetical protein
MGLSENQWYNIVRISKQKGKYCGMKHNIGLSKICFEPRLQSERERERERTRERETEREHGNSG